VSLSPKASPESHACLGVQQGQIPKIEKRTDGPLREYGG